MFQVQRMQPKTEKWKTEVFSYSLKPYFEPVKNLNMFDPKN
jgi:hypothetical protein